MTISNFMSNFDSILSKAQNMLRLAAERAQSPVTPEMIEKELTKLSIMMEDDFARVDRDALVDELIRRSAAHYKEIETMTVVTVTVNQWHIKDNSTNGTNKPVICVNRYEGVDVYYDEEGRVGRDWGAKVGDTEHHHDYEMPAGFMVYDPVNKTPCGASCWMEYEE